MQIQVSELIVKFMERLGIEAIFGMPGAHILPVYDSLYDSSIEAVLAKHEQGAAFMAGGHARASGGIGACITTAGPGATNLVTGIANAYADKQPLLAITGEAPTYIFGRGGLQESSGEGGSIDQYALFQGITRYNKIVERTDYLANVLNTTAKILLSDNPGPVLLSIPYNVQQELVDADLLERIKTRRSRQEGSRRALPIEAMGRLLAQSQRPVIVAGYGSIRSEAQEVIGRLSEQLNIPVATSLKGKGAVSEHSGLSLGSLGVTSSGNAYEYIAQQADLILFLGAGFNERTSYVWDETLLAGKRVIQVDHDPAQLEKVFRADLAVEGDIREIIGSLADYAAANDMAGKDLEPARPHLPVTKQEERRDYALFEEGFALIEKLFIRLEEAFPQDAVVFDDNIIFAQNFYKVAVGNRYHPNSGVSSLGHAIPAAIGAQFVEQKPTFAIIGDGGFQMCCMEIMTAVNYQKPLNIILFNNATMGLIRKNQHQHYEGRFLNCDFINPDFAQLARSFGINYKRVETETDLEELFADYDLEGAINLIDVPIHRDRFPNYSSKR